MRNNMNAVQNVSKRRDDRAGRRCTIGNRVYAKSVSGVRIPISPPELSRRNLYGNAFFIQSALKTGRLHPMRRGGRVVECGGLENRFTGNPGDEGSNPSSSARKLEALANAGAFSFSGQLRYCFGARWWKTGEKCRLIPYNQETILFMNNHRYEYNLGK